VLTRRIIPCLDVDAGRVVKGVRFQNLREMGDPLELARRYAREGADELVFLDISATAEGRSATLDLVAAVAREVGVPLTMGGGIRSVDDARAALRAGADKVAVNTAAVERPDLIDELAAAFGSQCVVLAVDARRAGPGWEVVTVAGSRATGIDAVAWCVEGVRRGAGEILLTSIDRDGTRGGYDLDLIRAVAGAVNVPVIASGGAGGIAHLVDALLAGADAVLAASMFHEGQVSIPEVKRELRRAGLPVRSGDVGEDWIDDLHFDAAGLVPVVVEAAGGVRMLAYADRQALARTVETGWAWFYSRSRGRLWQKGETSGNRLRVLAVDVDCDGDAVRYRVEPEGPTCHTGAPSCFYDTVWQADPGSGGSTRQEGDEGGGLPAALSQLLERIDARLDQRPEGSYVVRLAQDPDLALRKVGEEAVEVLVAAAGLLRDRTADPELRRHLVAEAADLLFHTLVLLRVLDIDPDLVGDELRRRQRPPGAANPVRGPAGGTPAGQG